MKKLFLILFSLLTALTFSSCSIQINTPEIPQSFTQNAVVTSGDFSFECEICKNNKYTAVTVKNTNAAGLVMTYDGKNINFKFDDYSQDISADNFEKANTAIIVYDVITSLQSNTVEKHIIDGGIKYEGETSFGKFILVQNDNSALKSLAFKNSDYSILFK